MNLSTHFTLEEMTYSEIAIRKGLDNTPDQAVKNNLVQLCDNLLEKVRERLDLPIKINSGYRSIAVNEAVGGVATSQHVKGEAADTVAIGISVKEYYQKIKNMVYSGTLVVDQCIYEYDSWVHLSFKKSGNRNQFLIKRQNQPYQVDNSR